MAVLLWNNNKINVMGNVKHLAVAAKLSGDDHLIPPITNPLGKAWTQPDRRLITFNENYDHAIISHETYMSLLNYSHSQPSGVYAGKMWRSGKIGSDTE